VPWFRKPSGDPLIVSMCSVKLGDRLLVVGCSDTGLVAALAARSGLSGRACMVCDAEPERGRAAAAVEEAGALVESVTAPFTALPFDAGSFDVVVLRNALPTLDAGGRARALADVWRVTRPGGRCIAIDDASRAGLTGLFKPRQASDYGGAQALLAGAGFRGVRTLAERQALIFVEGIKPALADTVDAHRQA
jgi:ubiquinone/menaquinone biosynthesis C-methylase UbiE